VRRQPRLSYVVQLAVVTAVYFGSAKAGLALAFANSSVTAIWPPTGLALAAVLLCGYRIWPAIALGAFLSNVTTAAPLGSVLGITAGNTLEALLGGYLLSRVGFNRSLERMRDVVALVALAGVVSTMASATIGVLSLWIGGAVAGDALPSTWRVWWLGDMGGDLLVAPVVLVLAARPRVVRRLAAKFEAGLLAAGLVLVSAIVLAHDSTLGYAVFPLLFWTALRFRQLGAVLASLLVSSIAVWYTAHGHGPFVGGSPDGDLLRAQTFVGVAAITALLVAAVRSERHEAETTLATLAEREQQLAEAQSLAHLGGWEWDIAANAVTWSDELYRIYGVDRTTFGASYEGFLGLVHEEDREWVDGIIREALERRRPFEFIHRIVRPGGEVRTLQARGRVICDERGEPMRMIGTGQDVTMLRLAEEKFRQLLEFAPDAIIGVGADGRIELINSQVEQLFGYSRDELTGKPLDVLVPERYRGVHPGHRDGYFQDPRVRPMGAGLELFARRRDGSEFPCEISLSSIHAEHGMIAVAAVRDVTERKRAEAEADRLKSEFFALVSHELRTPLTSIVGYVDLLREREGERLSSPAQEFLGVIERNTKRLDDLVQDVLLVAQIEAGTFAVEIGEMRISEVASLCEPEAKLAAAAAGVELTCDVQDLPPFAGDAKRLGQVLSNLASNAIKFTPPGGRVHVRIASMDGSCLIEVSDTGVGIEPADMTKLFDRFYRSKAAEGSQVKGTGLGLSIVKTIVEAHGGTIDVESTPGKGSTFRVLLPMKPRVESNHGQEATARTRRGTAASSHRRPSPAR
jgi:two-component system phosphate regulon sensor histidine kinase PhoR